MITVFYKTAHCSLEHDFLFCPFSFLHLVGILSVVVLNCSPAHSMDPTSPTAAESIENQGDDHHSYHHHYQAH